MVTLCIEGKKFVNKRQEALLCDGCNKWQHRTCSSGISREMYRNAVRCSLMKSEMSHAQHFLNLITWRGPPTEFDRVRDHRIHWIWISSYARSMFQMVS